MSQSATNNPPKTNILSSATELYDLGLCVIPIAKGKKTPAVSWKKYQVTRAGREEVESWFKKKSNYDLGVVTGSVSGVTVIDADSKTATQKIEPLLDKDTPIVQTPRGGRHFYFAYDQDLKTSTDTSLEIDVRNDGGIAVCPPTTRNNGEYVWLTKPKGEFPIIPSKLKALLVKPPPPPPNPGPPTEDKLDMGKYLTHYNIKFVVKEGDGCRIYQLFECPFSDQHTEGDGLGHAVIVQREDGLLTFHCKHAHCSDKTWRNVRETISGKDKCTPPDLWMDEKETKIINHLKLTDLGVAEAFTELYGEDFRFMQEPKEAPKTIYKGKWIFYNSCRWEAISEAEIRCMVLGILQLKEGLLIAWTPKTTEEHNMKKKAMGNCLYLERAPGLANTLTHIKATTNVFSDVFDRDDWLLGCQNAVIDLKTATKKNFLDERGQPTKNYIFKATNVEYDPDAKCPRWERFIQEIFLDDGDLINYIQMVIGYCLTGSAKEQCFFICYGTSENGKSTFLETLLKIWGEYGQSADFKTFYRKERPENTSSDVYRMKEKRFVRAIESDRTISLDTALIKALTGGDTMTKRTLYEEEVDFPIKAKYFFGVNHPPVISEMDDAIERRVHFIPFRAKFPKGSPQRDGTLKEKLWEERAGILNWAIFGCLKYQWTVEQFGHLPMAKAVEEETAKYILAQDPIKRFLREQTETKTGSEIGAGTLYDAFVRWCENAGEPSGNATVFGRRMMSLGYEKKNRNTGAFYQNLGFKIP